MTCQLPRWRTRAACQEHTELDFIEPDAMEADHCRAVCAGCPVRQHCLADALANREPWGIWGGLDTHERATLAIRSQQCSPKVLPAHGTNSRYAKHGCRCIPCRTVHSAFERARRARHQQQQDKPQVTSVP
ncbi:WhiB family transcriptional regulator [Saccharopolyspora rosea]|uniref:WhiB family transcriptional regulator n=1 Tax=Saccharopolyspora rosea TaxID=524884 RepID=UPI0021DA7A5D|nr:WhiB family transcriptional regulator [Saccharopolyspora rosea]